MRQGSFATLVDYFHDYRDCSDLYTEVQKLDTHDELEGHIDTLATLGVSPRYATCGVRLGCGGSADSQPFEATVVYIVIYPAGSEPTQSATSRKFRLG